MTRLAQHLTTPIFVVQLVVFALLMVGAFFQWKRAKLLEDIIANKDRLIELLEQQSNVRPAKTNGGIH